MGNFQPLEVVCRGSETQLQVGENLNYSIWRVNGSYKQRLDNVSYLVL